jgi:hypothetical protein
LKEEMAWGVAGGREEVARAAASPKQQGRSEVLGRGRESLRGRDGTSRGKKRKEGKKKKKKKKEEG